MTFQEIESINRERMSSLDLSLGNLELQKAFRGLLMAQSEKACSSEEIFEYLLIIIIIFLIRNTCWFDLPLLQDGWPMKSWGLTTKMQKQSWKAKILVSSTTETFWSVV